MKLITRNTDYAIRALAYMARKEDELTSATEIVKALKVPKQFLRSIMQKLGRNGFVKSYKGIGGGFKLSKRPSSVYIKDVAEAFQGAFRLNECLLGKSVCPNRKCCALKKKIDSIEKHVVSEMSSITVSDLLKG
ncbi:MAG: Rrf2 family transcriptional regulator [Candidatus Omnitrophica bacterium]|nr:Rrf2 family transcriptional regulator [Candidatus Omnitrophota bacterium]